MLNDKFLINQYEYKCKRTNTINKQIQSKTKNTRTDTKHNQENSCIKFVKDSSRLFDGADEIMGVIKKTGECIKGLRYRETQKAGCAERGRAG